MTPAHPNGTSSNGTTMATGVTNPDQPVNVISLGLDGERYHPTAERILDAAIEAIDTVGEAAVRLADIARSVDMTIPAMYRYFKDREDLIVAARIRRYDQLNAAQSQLMLQAAQSVTDAAGFAAVVDVVVDAMINPDRADELLARSEILARCRHNPQVRARVAAQQHHNVAIVTEVLQLAQARGWADPGVDILTVTRLFVAIMYGQVTWYLSDTNPDITERREAVRGILQSLIRPDADSPGGPAPLVTDATAG